MLTNVSTGRRARWFAGFVAGAAVGLGAMVVNYSADTRAQSAAEPIVPGPQASFADIIERVSPAVVNIAVTKVERTGAPGPEFRSDRPPSPFDEFFGRFFGLPPGVPFERRMEGLGSGFIIDEEGHVVTNNHVVEDATEIVVTLQDGQKFDATLVGRDPKTDLALLQIDGDDLPYVRFGDSDRARVGDWVIAIGNPFGLGGTATAGIISARGRDIHSGPYDDYMQIDAPINSGNSGGPVFNTAGEVIGVNTAIFTPNGGNIGIGFAIPANQARSVIEQLKEDGSVERGWLGVHIQDLDEELAETLGLDGTEGALVADVMDDSPASRAGVQSGDVITRFDGQSVDSSRTLSRLVAEARPGEKVSVTVWRDGDTKQLSVELGNQAVEDTTVAGASGPARGGAPGELGLTLRGLTDQDRAQLGLPAGVDGALVARVAPGSPAAEKGIRPGDVITAVNRTDVNTVSDAVRALNEARNRDENALLLVRRGDVQRFVALSFS
ncbi:MAG TPA: DegQ family serine endoprotease [Gammaproteobacteria bacterium]